MVRTRRICPIHWMVLAVSIVLLAALVAGLWPAMAGRTRADSLPPTMGVFGAAEGNGCGPATLYCICRLDGKDYSLMRLRELANTTSSGTTMLDLKRAAEHVGFRVAARNGAVRPARTCRKYQGVCDSSHDGPRWGAFPGRGGRTKRAHNSDCRHGPRRGGSRRGRLSGDISLGREYASFEG